MFECIHVDVVLGEYVHEKSVLSTAECFEHSELCVIAFREDGGDEVGFFEKRHLVGEGGVYSGMFFEEFYDFEDDGLFGFRLRVLVWGHDLPLMV